METHYRLRQLKYASGKFDKNEDITVIVLAFRKRYVYMKNTCFPLMMFGQFNSVIPLLVKAIQLYLL